MMLPLPDGYGRLRERHSSEERMIDEEDGTHEGDGEDTRRASKSEGSERRLSGKATELLGAPARMVKRMMRRSEDATTEEDNSRYRQFMDADSDDVDKENPDPPAEPPPPRPPADSSSEADGAERFYGKPKDFAYQELDDEFGSRRSGKSSHDFEDTSDATLTTDDAGYSHPPQPPKPNPAPSQHDRIVGHEYGVKPLLDDDELSDSEQKVNPFGKPVSSKGSSLGGGVYDGSAGLPSGQGLDGLPPRHPDSSPAMDHNKTMDIFGEAPFRKEVKRKPKMTSPATRMDSEDVFNKAPFKHTRVKALSPPQHGSLTFVNQAVMGDTDVFQAAPFKGSKGSLHSHGSTPVSPSNAELRSPSQSPESAMARSPAPAKSQRADVPHAPTPPLSPSQVNDLFGSDNFSSLTGPQAQAALSRHGRFQPAKDTMSYSPGPVLHPPTLPPTARQPPPPPPTTLTTKPPQDGAAKTDTREGKRHLSGGSSHKKSGKVTPTRSRNKSGGHSRRRTSSDSRSSGSEDKPSPRQVKKDRYFSRSHELLHDENTEVLVSETQHGSLRKARQKAKREKQPKEPKIPKEKLPKDRPAADFVNLSFMDDRDPDDLEEEPRSNDASPYPMGELGRTDALRNSNAPNFPPSTPRSHTLPRMGASTKQRPPPSPPGGDPFVSKKKTAGIFKWD